MNGIERYIKENIEAFDAVPVPEGSRETFLKKLYKERRRGRTILLSFSSVAAAAALLLSIFPYNMEIEIRKHHWRLAIKEKEILASVGSNDPEEQDRIKDIIRCVITDVIPLEDQLPDELAENEKREILKEYYHDKWLALDNILNQYAQSL